MRILSFYPCLNGYFHTTDREEYVKKYAEILSEKHKLISLEELNYKPISLETLINNQTQKLAEK